MEHFQISGPKDVAGIDRAIQITAQALEKGVNYVDIADTYSSGQGMKVLREALCQTHKHIFATAKVMYGRDRTADDVRRRVELYLKTTGLDRMSYFTCWAVSNYEDFKKIMHKGGIYDGALKLQQEGIIDHICAYMHAPPEEILKILMDGAFAGITVSYSILNALGMEPVLDLAMEKGVGVIAMNPLSDGVIVRNPDFFSFACCPEDNGDVLLAALRFSKAHPAVDIVLGDIYDISELDVHLDALCIPENKLSAERMDRVKTGILIQKVLRKSENI